MVTYTFPVIELIALFSNIQSPHMAQTQEWVIFILYYSHAKIYRWEGRNLLTIQVHIMGCWLDGFKGVNRADFLNVAWWVSKYNDDNTDKLTKALLETIIYVSHHLLMEKAILLPWASKVFLQAYDTEVTGSVKSARVIIHTGDNSLLFSVSGY